MIWIQRSGSDRSITKFWYYRRALIRILIEGNQNLCILPWSVSGVLSLNVPVSVYCLLCVFCCLHNMEIDLSDQYYFLWTPYSLKAVLAIITVNTIDQNIWFNFFYQITSKIEQRKEDPFKVAFTKARYKIVRVYSKQKSIQDYSLRYNIGSIYCSP